MRWAFSRVGGIPVERGTADMKCLRAAQHALQRGEDVLIFPEGTRIRSREIKPEVHGGFALIAQMGKAPVNPPRHLWLVRHHACGQKDHATQEVLDPRRQGHLAFRRTGRA